jgi:hypothetical protein
VIVDVGLAGREFFELKLTIGHDGTDGPEGELAHDVDSVEIGIDVP